jgi:hypothetical protein
MYDYAKMARHRRLCRITVNDSSVVLCWKKMTAMRFQTSVCQVANENWWTLWFGISDVYFEFKEERKGRTVETLRFKLFRKNAMNVKTNWFIIIGIDLFFFKLLLKLWKPKNDVFVRRSNYAAAEILIL